MPQIFIVALHFIEQGYSSCAVGNISVYIIATHIKNKVRIIYGCLVIVGVISSHIQNERIISFHIDIVSSKIHYEIISSVKNLPFPVPETYHMIFIIYAAVDGYIGKEIGSSFHVCHRGCYSLQFFLSCHCIQHVHIGKNEESKGISGIG